jgi:outer membrane protein assembly factor BamE (lipoprotein component of BamABCDE complex)
MSIPARLTLPVTLASALLVSGCLIGRNSHTEASGTYVSPETISRIEPGKPAAYVVALLGEPDTKTEVGEGRELWKWSYAEKKTSSGSLLFVFGGTSTSETRCTSFVEFKDGVVEHAWRDG